MECNHQPDPLQAGPGVRMLACPVCGQVEFFAAGERLEPFGGMAALFGDYVLVDTLPSAGAGVAEVSVYRPGRKRAAVNLTPLPRGRWWEPIPGLLLATDGSHLLTASREGALPGGHRPPPLVRISQNPVMSVLAPQTSTATRSPGAGR